MRKSSKFWNRIASSYDSSVQKRYQSTYQEMVSLTKKYLNQNDLMLDVGCGTGITTIELSPYVRRIDAFDISERMIELAIDKATKSNTLNINYQICDIMNDKFKSDSYDVITVYNVLLFFSPDENPLRRIHQLLKPGGMFLSATDCYSELGFVLKTIAKLFSSTGIMPMIKEYSCQSLEEEIEKSGFSIIDKKVLFKKPLNYFIIANKI